jgi:hypothetical protein
MSEECTDRFKYNYELDKAKSFCRGTYMRYMEHAYWVVSISFVMALFMGAALAQVDQPMDSNLSVNKGNLEYFAGLNITKVTPTGNDEYAVLYNNGDRAMSLLGWMISIDNMKNITLPDFIIEPLTGANIHFGKGVTNVTDLYLNQSANILNDKTGDIKLIDDSGGLVSEVKY